MGKDIQEEMLRLGIWKPQQSITNYHDIKGMIDNPSDAGEIGDQKATISRPQSDHTSTPYCLILPSLSLEVGRQYGVANWSLDRDLNHDAEEINNSLRLSSKAINAMEAKSAIQSTTNKTTVDGVMADVLMGEISDLREQVAQLRQAVDMALDAMSNGGDKATTGDDDRIIQLADRTPDKMTLQVFLNEGRKIPPNLKLELRERARDKNGKSYYSPYQKLYAKCLPDFGRGRLDKFANMPINQHDGNKMDGMRNLIEVICDNFDDDYIGGFFYDKDRGEVFWDMAAIFSRSKMTGYILVDTGEKYQNIKISFAASKSTGTERGANGIYHINSDKIAEIFDGDSAVDE